MVALKHDEARDESALVVIDAAGFCAEPVAEIVTPRRVPSGAHGAWMPE